jgi:hypothetical protein
MHPQTMPVTAEIALHTSMWDRPFKALLMCIRALFDLIAKDKFMPGVYMLITLFLFCPEFLVVLIYF